MKKSVLDSFAVLAFLFKEPGYEKVLKLLHTASEQDEVVFMAAPNWAEVRYIVERKKGVDEWQTMEAILVGNRVTVTLNGKRVHDNVAIIGVTGGALDGDELSPGPLMIQGDHEQVWFRKVVVTPIVTAGK